MHQGLAEVGHLLARSPPLCRRPAVLAAGLASSTGGRRGSSPPSRPAQAMAWPMAMALTILTTLQIDRNSEKS
jgi:hypothetical protein